MDFPTSISQFASGAAIQDSVTPSLTSMATQNSSLGGLSSIPGISTAASAISSLVSSATTQWAAILAQLPIALPAMTAVHILEKKLEMAAGGISSSQGSATFEAYFGAIASVKSQIAALQTSVSASFAGLAVSASGVPGVTGTGAAALTSLADVIPPQTIPDPSNPSNTIPNPAFATFMSSNSAAIGSMSSSASALGAAASSANTSIAAQFSAASSAYQSGMSNLKGMAFASFCARPQPTPVQAVISQNINPAAIPSTDDIYKANRSGSTWLATQTITAQGSPPLLASTNPDTAGARPPVSDTQYVATTATATQLAAIDAQAIAARTSMQAASQAADATYPPFQAWKDSVNYDAVKNNQDVDPQAYAALKAQAQAQPSYLDMVAKVNAYNSALATYKHLLEVRNYMRDTGPWPGNPDGPW